MASVTVPSIGMTTTEKTLLLAIDDHLLPLERNLCYYITKPHVRPQPVLTPSRDNPDAPDHLGTHFYGTVLLHEGEYRMWYYGISLGDKAGAHSPSTPIGPTARVSSWEPSASRCAQSSPAPMPEALQVATDAPGPPARRRAGGPGRGDGPFEDHI